LIPYSHIEPNQTDDSILKADNWRSMSKTTVVSVEIKPSGAGQKLNGPQASSQISDTRHIRQFMSSWTTSHITKTQLHDTMREAGTILARHEKILRDMLK
jgi:hypothetical protein